MMRIAHGAMRIACLEGGYSAIRNLRLMFKRPLTGKDHGHPRPGLIAGLD